MVGSNLLANQVDSSLIPLIGQEWLRSLAVLSIILLLVHLILNISSLVDDICRMIEQSLEIECIAIARLPSRSADVTELIPAKTGHMVAAGCELDHSAASLASLPSLLMRGLDKLL